MTQEQQELIRAYRINGLGYRRIARIMGLPLKTIESHCLSHGLNGPANLVSLNSAEYFASQGLCRSCGKPLAQQRRGRTRQFCSGKCRVKYWRSVHAWDGRVWDDKHKSKNESD